jgi:hypothetical protein
LEIVSALPKSCLLKDEWCRLVNSYLQDGVYPDDFVGHCCELSEKRCKLGVDNTSPIKATRFDGHLYLPQFSILIDSPMDCVDLHALGGNNLVEAVWHCVVSDKAAERFAKDQVQPNGENAHIDDGGIVVIEVADNLKVRPFSGFSF